MQRKYFITFIFIAVIISFYIFILRPQQQNYYANHVNIHGIYLMKPLNLENFVLTDNHNNKFTNLNLKNHWTFIFFGFTRCPMICPTTMKVLADIYKTIAKDSPASIPQVVFISIDPENDSIQDLNNFVHHFNKNFIGAKTTVTDTEALKNQFHIISTNQNNTIDHSTDILLINPDAQIQAYFTFPHNANIITKEYFTILKKYQK